MCQEYFYYLITIVSHNYITFLQIIYYNVDIFLFINKTEMQDSKLILVALTFTNGRWQKVEPEGRTSYFKVHFPGRTI